MLSFSHPFHLFSQAKVHLFGHIHEQRGHWQRDDQGHYQGGTSDGRNPTPPGKERTRRKEWDKQINYQAQLVHDFWTINSRMQRLCSGTLFLQQKNDREQTWERLQGGERIFSKMKKTPALAGYASLGSRTFTEPVKLLRLLLIYIYMYIRINLYVYIYIYI